MALRNTQDALIIEQQWTSGTLRSTQDALLVEWLNTTAKVRVTQDVMICEFPFINYMFVYQASVGNLVGFTPVYPPRGKQPLYQWGLEAKRADSVTVDGIKKSVLDHIDQVTILTFPFVSLSDMAAFKAFEQFALTGGTFAYRPMPDYPVITPGDNTGFSTFTLVNMDWTPKFESPAIFSLAMKLKLVADL
jgi:hypothetical protein